MQQFNSPYCKYKDSDSVWPEPCASVSRAHAKQNPCSYKEVPVSSEFQVDWSQGRLREKEAHGMYEIKSYGSHRLSRSPKILRQTIHCLGHYHYYDIRTLTGSGSGPLDNSAMQDNNNSSLIVTNPKNLKENLFHLWTYLYLFKGKQLCLRWWVARTLKYSFECPGIKWKWYVEGANKDRVFYMKPQTAQTGWPWGNVTVSADLQ